MGPGVGRFVWGYPCGRRLATLWLVFVFVLRGSGPKGTCAVHYARGGGNSVCWYGTGLPGFFCACVEQLMLYRKERLRRLRAQWACQRAVETSGKRGSSRILGRQIHRLHRQVKGQKQKRTRHILRKLRQREQEEKTSRNGDSPHGTRGVWVQLLATLTKLLKFRILLHVCIINVGGF